MKFTDSINVEVVQYESRGCPYRARFTDGPHRGKGIHLAFVTGAVVAKLGIIFARYDLDISYTNYDDEPRIVWECAAKKIWQKFPGYTILLDPPPRELDSPPTVIEAPIPLVTKPRPKCPKQLHLYPSGRVV